MAQSMNIPKNLIDFGLVQVEGKALAEGKFTLDLEMCNNVVIDDSDETKIEVDIPCMEEVEVCSITKTKPFKFCPKFNLEEDPLDMEEQREKLQPEVDAMKEKMDEVRETIESIPYEVMAIEDIEAALKDEGVENFIDPDFPPVDKSVYDTSTEEYPYKQVIHWRRPCDFMEGEISIFEDDVDPNDINQGELANCWFLSALSCLAERPILVKRLFLQDSFNEQGIYRIKVCKNGEWVTVTVDDYIPCYYNAGPMFARANGNELWVLLLEKAYAKVHGNYQALRYGATGHGMMDLTGCPTRLYKFPPEKDDIEEHEEMADQFWSYIHSADSRGFLITAETGGWDDVTENGGPSGGGGLVSGHAYSVMKIVEADGVKLLNIRNPWGEFEWDGAWADGSDEWTDEMIELVEPTFDGEDGSFWMSYADFMKKFESMNICEVSQWNELRLKGKFVKTHQKGNEDNDFVLTKFAYQFKVTEETDIHIGIHQEDERIFGVKDRRPYQDISFAIFKKLGNKLQLFNYTEPST